MEKEEMSEPSMKLVSVSTQGHEKLYTPQAINSFGMQYDQFSSDCAVVIFSLSAAGQRSLLQVWLRRDDVPEDEWIRHARAKAIEMIAALAQSLPLGGL
jgi:hypothetical protein